MVAQIPQKVQKLQEFFNRSWHETALWRQDRRFLMCTVQMVCFQSPEIIQDQDAFYQSSASSALNLATGATFTVQKDTKAQE